MEDVNGVTTSVSSMPSRRDGRVGGNARVLRERVRRLGMDDTLVVTPFNSSTYKILPVGITFRTAPAVAR